jgi:hypothetical protein
VPSLPSLAGRVVRHRGKVLAVLAVFALGLLHGRALLDHFLTSLDPFCFADDVRVLIYPLFRVEDPGLFPGDPIVEYYLAGLPDGYHLFYRLLGPVFGVAPLAKTLPYVLYLGALVALALATFRFGGPVAAFGTLSLALGSDYLLGRIVGGLPRGFAAPLIAGGAACLVFGRARLLAVLTVVAAGFYPVASLVLGVTLAGLLLLPEAQRGCTALWSLKKRAVLLAGTGFVSLSLLVPSMVRMSRYGPPITSAELAQYPEAGPGGRFQEADRAPFSPLPMAALPPLRAALTGAEAPLLPLTDARRFAAVLCPVLALFAALGWIVQARRRAEALRLALLPVAVVLCHTASLLFEPRLFIPERHVAYAVPVIALIAVPSTLAVFARAENRRLRALPVLFVGLVMALLGARGSPWTGLTVRIPPHERPLYDALSRLPRRAVIAGFPNETTDTVPYLSRRSVLSAFETHMPFHSGFADLARERFRALASGYFATTREDVMKLRDHGVTHVLLDRNHMKAPPPYFVPFGAETAKAFERGRAAGFFLENIAANAVVFGSGELRVIELSRL